MVRRGRTILNTIAASISDRIEALSDKELRALARHCDKLTSSNCAWFCYGIGPSVRERVSLELLSRKIARRKARQKGTTAC